MPIGHTNQWAQRVYRAFTEIDGLEGGGSATRLARLMRSCST